MFQFCTPCRPAVQGAPFCAAVDGPPGAGTTAPVRGAGACACGQPDLAAAGAHRAAGADGERPKGARPPSQGIRQEHEKQHK